MRLDRDCRRLGFQVVDIILIDLLRVARAFTCCLLACAFCAPSASAQYRFDTWDRRRRAAAEFRLRDLQARDGCLWFTTLDVAGALRWSPVQTI